jgi:L-ascorbate metabolism protein UlaG (beta-lactamase superfamily)
MLVLFLIIGFIAAAAVFLWKRSHQDHGHSPNWNPITKEFFHHWKPVNKIITFKVFIEFMKAPKARWPHTVTINPASAPKQSKELLITNIGHATFLIQMNHVNIITDPVFSNYAGPMGRMGPKRVVAPGIPINELPPIDVAFISHNHYDHLDKFSVRYLAQHHDVTFVVPLGMKQQLQKWKITRPIIELDWWDSIQIASAKITATPAQHWSRRTLFDANKSLWIGGIFETDMGSVFFAGDTGFGPHFHEIAQRFDSIDVGLLPIGSYKPRSIMAHQHMSPQDALNAHMILKTKCFIPIHYDVFPLGKEHYLEAEDDLIKTADSIAVPRSDIKILKVAQQLQHASDN